MYSFVLAHSQVEAVRPPPWSAPAAAPEAPVSAPRAAVASCQQILASVARAPAPPLIHLTGQDWRVHSAGAGAGLTTSGAGAGGGALPTIQLAGAGPRSEQINFQATDPELGPVLVSVRDLEAGEGQPPVTQLSLRLSIGTFQETLSQETEAWEPENITAAARRMCPNLSVDCFAPIISRRASNVIADFDEKSSLGRTRQYKFGLVEQRRGQFTEEEVFGNTAASPALDTFLAMLGDTVQLRGHRGYSGGLDTRHDQTGRLSLYTRHRGAEVMFHVAHYLPHRSAVACSRSWHYAFKYFSAHDPQQLARKRHIGNDIVCLVFQQVRLSSCSSMFLHDEGVPGRGGGVLPRHDLLTVPARLHRGAAHQPGHLPHQERMLA